MDCQAVKRFDRNLGKLISNIFLCVRVRVYGSSAQAFGFN